MATSPLKEPPSWTKSMRISPVSAVVNSPELKNLSALGDSDALVRLNSSGEPVRLSVSGDVEDVLGIRFSSGLSVIGGG